MARESANPQVHLAKWEIQLRKGMLDLVILLSLQRKEQYGFELISGISRQASFDLPEGTLYPLLLRLEKDGLVASRLVAGGGGAPRKYYTLTPLGAETIAHMTASWRQLEQGINAMIEAKPC